MSKKKVVVYNRHYSQDSAITYVVDETGLIASFPYKPNSIASITQRLLDFAGFSVTRNIDVIEVLGEDLVI